VASNRSTVLKKSFLTVMQYVLWAITILLGLWCLLVARGAINVAYILTFANQWVLRAVDRFSLLIMGIIWLVAIIIVEDYLGKGVDRGDLYKRFLKIAGAEVLFGALMLLVTATVG